MTDKKVIANATIMITAVALVSKVLGFIATFIMAAKFGANFKTDAYFIASNIPELLRDVLAGGALTSAFIPVYTTYLAKNEKVEAQKLAAGIFNILLVALILMSLLGIIFAPALTRVVAPGFNGQTLDLAVKMTRLLFPSIIFFGLASLFGAILNSYNHFTVPALQPLILNSANIICLLWFTNFMDIYVMVAASITGGIAITLMNLPSLYRKGIRYLPELNLKQEGIKKIGVLWFPLILGLSVNQANIVINKMLASGLSAGSISALNYANLINQIAPSVFGVAVSTAIFPSLSWHVALAQHDKFRDIVSKAIRITLLITVPLTVGLVFLSIPVIRFLFERGAFTREATILTSGVLIYFGVGTFALALNYVLIRAFYALNDTKTPVKLAITAVITNIILSMILVKVMAQNGLALASSIATMIQMGLLLIFLQKKIGNLKLKSLFADFLKTGSSAVAAVGMGAWFISHVNLFGEKGSFFSQLLNLMGTTLLVGAVYGLLIFLLKVEERNHLLQIFGSKSEVKL